MKERISRMQQEDLRKRLRELIASEGITQKFIARKIFIDEPVLLKFKNGKAVLLNNDIEKLDNFLKSKGY